MATIDGMRLLSHPFRLNADGSAATVLDNTDEALVEGIAVLALTRRGERPYAPTFGTSDPTFDADMDLADLNVALALHGPAVTVTGVEVSHATDTAARVVIEFTADDDPDEDLNP